MKNEKASFVRHSCVSRTFIPVATAKGCICAEGNDIRLLVVINQTGDVVESHGKARVATEVMK